MFTFRASRALSSARTVEPPPAAQVRPGRSGGAARRPGLRWGSPPGSAAASEQRRMAPMAAPRCTTVAEVMINDKYMLSERPSPAGLAVWPRPDREMTDVSKVALRLYRQSMHESLSTMHAYANVHREVWSSRLGTHMESHYRTTTTIGVSSLDVYSNEIHGVVS